MSYIRGSRHGITRGQVSDLIAKIGVTTDLTPYRTSADQDVIDAGKLDIGTVYLKAETYTKAEVDALMPASTDLTPYRTSADQDLIDAGKLDTGTVYLKAETYTKAEVDALMPASVDLTPYRTSADTDVLLDAKVNKAGDTSTGKQLTTIVQDTSNTDAQEFITRKYFDAELQPRDPFALNNLYPNGKGFLRDNTNHAGTIATTDNILDMGTTRNFKFTKESQYSHNQFFIPLDVSKSVSFSAKVIQHNLREAGDTGYWGSTHFQLELYDLNDRLIHPYDVNAWSPVMTLTQDINVGDTEIHVDDCSKMADQIATASHMYGATLVHAEPIIPGLGTNIPGYFPHDYISTMWDFNSGDQRVNSGATNGVDVANKKIILNSPITNGHKALVGLKIGDKVVQAANYSQLYIGPTWNSAVYADDTLTVIEKELFTNSIAPGSYTNIYGSTGGVSTNQNYVSTNKIPGAVSCKLVMRANNYIPQARLDEGNRWTIVGDISFKQNGDGSEAEITSLKNTAADREFNGRVWGHTREMTNIYSSTDTAGAWVDLPDGVFTPSLFAHTTDRWVKATLNATFTATFETSARRIRFVVKNAAGTVVATSFPKWLVAVYEAGPVDVFIETYFLSAASSEEAHTIQIQYNQGTVAATNQRDRVLIGGQASGSLQLV